MTIEGTFEITLRAEPPYDAVDGVTLARVSFDKRFAGALDATSQVQMIGVRTPVEGSAAYVAIERVTGTLAGRHGTFVLQHTGVMRRGESALTVAVVPDSGTGELRGVSGTMEIHVLEGQHRYVFDFELGG